MAYKHKQVSDINTHQPQFFHHHTLQLFCEELTKQMRGVKTTPRDDKSQWVYVDGEMMARGWVGFGDFRSSREGDPKFVVCARGISNGKYAEHSYQHYMKMSVNMSVTLKAAKAYLVKYTTREVEGVLRADTRQTVDSIREKARTELRNAVYKVGVTSYGSQKDRLMQELRRLVTADHTFGDPQLGADVRGLIAAQTTLDSLPSAIPMDFVHIYPTPWETRADILHVEDILTLMSQARPTSAEQSTWVADELPESVMGKIAVMQMCEDGHYVDGVGVRVNEHTFYFHSEGSDTWS